MLNHSSIKDMVPVLSTVHNQQNRDLDQDHKKQNPKTNNVHPRAVNQTHKTVLDPVHRQKKAKIRSARGQINLRRAKTAPDRINLLQVPRVPGLDQVQTRIQNLEIAFKVVTRMVPHRGRDRILVTEASLNQIPTSPPPHSDHLGEIPSSRWYRLTEKLNR
jgi:hypothetical protein